MSANPQEAFLAQIGHVAAALLCLGTSSVALSSSPSKLQVGQNLLQRCLQQEADREGLSGAVLVSANNQTLASIVRGRRADETSSAIDSRTRFNLGSASKMFTAVAIGQLVARNKLSLDQPVGQIVRGLTPEASNVTIRQLLTHTAGLGDFFRPKNMQAMLKARSAADILPLIAADKPRFPPGSKFSYSNSGFALLGIVIERVSGMTYGQYLQTHVFGPAGMTSTGLDPKPLATLAVGMTAGGMSMPPPDQRLVLIGPDGKPLPVSTQPPADAQGLKLIGPGKRPINSSRADGSNELSPAPGSTEGYGSPAGGLFSTTEDMHRFAVALLDGKLLPPAMAHTFTTAQVEAAPPEAGRPARQYGFGFTVGDSGGLIWFGHGGGTLGANAEFAVQPDHQWVVSVLSNRDPPVATNIMRWTTTWLTSRHDTETCS